MTLFPKYNVFIRRTATCWLWTAGTDACGYGQIANPPYASITTHRLAWVFRYGPIPKGKHVLHKCDVRNCVNPDHLFLGDQASNMKDAAAKGRLVGNRKLTDAQVAEIRARYVRRQNGKALAAEFGVSLLTVCRIAANRQRVHRTAPAPAPAVSGAASPRPIPPQPSVVVGQQG